MIKEAIVKIVSKEDLTYDEAYAVMNEIMSGETTPTQNAAFLAALSTKSARAETTDEIAGCAAAMRAHAVQVDTGMEVFEIVGTGGDNAHSFNISTTSGLVAAAGGMKVAKHGNRAASSQCGTADCLETLGVNIQQSPQRCIQLLREVGMCFFFAQKYHTSMKYVGTIRKELGFRTVFNILGPLTNPGKPSMQLLGVYDDYLVAPLAQVLINLGVRRGMVVYGQDKLDEISMSAPTSVCEIKDSWFKAYTIAPEDFGLKRCTREDLRGGTPAENAGIVGLSSPAGSGDPRGRRCSSTPGPPCTSAAKRTPCRTAWPWPGSSWTPARPWRPWRSSSPSAISPRRPRHDHFRPAGRSRPGAGGGGPGGEQPGRPAGPVPRPGAGQGRALSGRPGKAEALVHLRGEEGLPLQGAHRQRFSLPEDCRGL